MKSLKFDNGDTFDLCDQGHLHICSTDNSMTLGQDEIKQLLDFLNHYAIS